jgi:hypothetical protein
VKIRIHLGDADKERLGAPADLEVDPYKVSIREMVVLQKGVEIEGVVCTFDSPDEWRKALGKANAFAILVLVWLGLRRAGLTPDLASMTVDDDAEVRFDSEATDVGEPGKGRSRRGTTSSSRRAART